MSLFFSRIESLWLHSLWLSEIREAVILVKWSLMLSLCQWPEREFAFSLQLSHFCLSSFAVGLWQILGERLRTLGCNQRDQEGREEGRAGDFWRLASPPKANWKGELPAGPTRHAPLQVEQKAHLSLVLLNPGFPSPRHRDAHWELQGNVHGAAEGLRWVSSQHRALTVDASGGPASLQSSKREKCAPSLWDRLFTESLPCLIKTWGDLSASPCDLGSVASQHGLRALFYARPRPALSEELLRQNNRCHSALINCSNMQTPVVLSSCSAVPWTASSLLNVNKLFNYWLSAAW